MSKMVKRISLKQGDEKEYFYFDATTGIKGYDLYNTEEVIVGKWTNGKPIYRKVFTGLSVTWKRDAWVNLVATAANNIELATKVMLYASGCWIVPEEWKTGNGYVAADTGYVGGTRVINQVVIEYTKTTDQPDSFKEEKVELTAEHNTGFTFNGEDVYEMVITGRTNASSNDTDVDVSGLNIKSIISLYGFLGISSVSSSYSSWAIPYSWGGSANDFVALYFPGTSLDYNTLKVTVGTNTRRNQPYTISIRYTKK